MHTFVIWVSHWSWWEPILIAELIPLAVTLILYPFDGFKCSRFTTGLPMWTAWESLWFLLAMWFWRHDSQWVEILFLLDILTVIVSSPFIVRRQIRSLDRVPGPKLLTPANVLRFPAHRK